MKTIAAFILSFLLSFGGASAATTTATLHVANKYLAFGSGIELHSDPVVQSGITTTFDNGIFLGVWTSFSLDGESNLGDEIDLTVGWSGDVGWGWNMGYALVYFDEPSLLNFGPGDIVYNKLAFSRPVGDYNFTATVRNYYPVNGSGFNGGWVVGAGFSREFKLSEKLAVFTSAELKYDDGGLGFDNGFILNPFVSLSYKLTDAVTLDIIQANAHIQLTTNDKRESDIMWSTGMKLTF